MRVIPPIAVDAAHLTSTNVAEPSAGESVWSNATNYKAGDRVINTTTHRTYESQQGQQAVVTITNANPGVVTWINHGLAATTPIIFSTTGALPTGLTAGTTYYVIADTVNSFKLSASIGGSNINTTGTQSGTHTALANYNRARDPTTDDGTWWVDVGPTNKWAMFDLTTTMPTEAASPLVVEWTLGERSDSVGFSGLIADEMLVEAIVGGLVVKSWTLSLRYRAVTTWYEHLTTPFSYRGATAIWDVPAETSLTLRVTLTRASGNVKCGFAIPGRQIYLGRALYGAENDGASYARVKTDDYGNSQVTPGQLKNKTRQNVRFKKERSARLLEARRSLSGKTAFWSALDDPTDPYFEPLQLVGFYDGQGGFTLTFDQPNEGLLALSLREL